jgi:hypothetical protein
MKITLLIAFAAVGLIQAAPTEQIINPQNALFEVFERLCVTMLPEHNDLPRQPEPFPVTITRTPEGPYRPGQQVLVTLRGVNGFVFRGFLIQARAFGSTVPVGTWAAGATARSIGCISPQVETFPDGYDTGVHLRGTERNVQEMVWIAPSAPGNYRFELSTVERYGVYWMEQFSSQFTVTA